MIDFKEDEILIIMLFLDAVKYTRYLFSIIDRNHKGTFTFDVRIYKKKEFCFIL